MFEYRALVTKVYDGDTITVDIDLGLNVWAMNQKIRLFGINAPEIRGEERDAGIKSRDWLHSHVYGKMITIRTRKAEGEKGKYGRWLGEIFLPGDDVSLNERMVRDGRAVTANY